MWSCFVDSVVVDLVLRCEVGCSLWWLMIVLDVCVCVLFCDLNASGFVCLIVLFYCDSFALCEFV